MIKRLFRWELLNGKNNDSENRGGTVKVNVMTRERGKRDSMREEEMLGERRNWDAQYMIKP